MLFFIGCGMTKSNPADDEKNSKISRSPQNPQEVLNFINHRATDADVLKYSVNLTITQANNIYNNKKGSDGIYGTADDNTIDNIQELDDIPYIGQASIDAIDNYVTNQWMNADHTKPTKYQYAVNYLNHRTLDYKKLNETLGLDADVSDNIYYFRTNADSYIGTADDSFFTSAYSLDNIPQVGDVTFADVLNKCNERNIQGSENIYSAEIIWGKYENDSTAEFKSNSIIKLRNGINKNNVLKSSEFLLRFDTAVITSGVINWDTTQSDWSASNAGGQSDLQSAELQ